MKEISQFTYEEAEEQVVDDLRYEIRMLIDRMSACEDPELACAKIECMETLIEFLMKGKK